MLVSPKVVEGIKAFESQDYGRVIDLLSAIYLEYSRNIVINYYLAKAFSLLNCSDRSLHYYKQVLMYDIYIYIYIARHLTLKFHTKYF